MKRKIHNSTKKSQTWKRPNKQKGKNPNNINKESKLKTNDKH